MDGRGRSSCRRMARARRRGRRRGRSPRLWPRPARDGRALERPARRGRDDSRESRSRHTVERAVLRPEPGNLSPPDRDGPPRRPAVVDRVARELLELLHRKRAALPQGDRRPPGTRGRATARRRSESRRRPPPSSSTSCVCGPSSNDDTSCASTSGPSAIVDPLGRVVSRTSFFTQTTLAGTIHPNRTTTWYARVGDLFAWLCTLVTIAFAIRRHRDVPPDSPALGGCAFTAPPCVRWAPVHICGEGLLAEPAKTA